MQDLVPTLLDFERAPGRHALALRQPRLLFKATNAVMLLAAGRPVEGLPPLSPGQHTGAIQQAARFFLRTVLLRPGADHYSLLGLSRDFKPATLRDHYRLMIRLTHPDFVASGEPWPADAASRINIANDVLGSAIRRASYDASLKVVASPAPEVSPKVAPRRKPRASLSKPLSSPGAWRRSGTARHAIEACLTALVHHRKVVLAAAGGLAGLGLLWLLTPSDVGSSLVAKRPRLASDARALPTPIASKPFEADVTALARVKAWLAEHTETSAVTEPLASSAQNELRSVAKADPPDPLPKNASQHADLNTQPASLPTTIEGPTETVASKLTMAQVQPKLAQLLDGLRSGKGENVLSALGEEWREHPAASAFVNSFERMLAGQSVVRLGKVQLRSRSEGEQLVVDGLVELYLRGGAPETQIKTQQMSAYFLQMNGQPMLTKVVLKQP